MDQSTVNLSPYPNSADIVEQFGLHHLNPSPLHYSAIQGEASILYSRIVWQEENLANNSPN